MVSLFHYLLLYTHMSINIRIYFKYTLVVDLYATLIYPYVLSADHLVLDSQLVFFFGEDCFSYSQYFLDYTNFV